MTALAQFVQKRRRWLAVRAVPGRFGKGFDIALILDGTYYGDLAKPGPIAELTRGLAEWLQEALADEGLLVELVMHPDDPNGIVLQPLASPRPRTEPA